MLVNRNAAKTKSTNLLRNLDKDALVLRSVKPIHALGYGEEGFLRKNRPTGRKLLPSGIAGPGHDGAKDRKKKKKEEEKR